MRTCQHSEREGVEVLVMEEVVVVEVVMEEVGVAASASDDNRLIFLKILLMLKYTILHQTALAS